MVDINSLVNSAFSSNTPSLEQPQFPLRSWVLRNTNLKMNLTMLKLQQHGLVKQLFLI